MAWLYLLILLVLAAALVVAYRVLGTPSRLAPRDYDVVLADIESSVERAADRLRRALDAGPGGALEDEATAARKIFQTGYYQTLRLRPSRAPSLRSERGRSRFRGCALSSATSTAPLSIRGTQFSSRPSCSRENGRRLSHALPHRRPMPVI